MAKQKRRSDCPISFALEIFGDRWSLLIIRDLMFKGKRTYGDFLASEEKIATNILADRLVMLEDSGIIKGKTDPENRSRINYSLTPKGIDLIPVLLEIIKWSAKHDKKSAAPKEFVDRVIKNREKIIKEIEGMLKGEIHMNK
ncbi:MAG: winged helix-turn-helix transcriptional regulator [Bacteroidota bacterium]